MDVFAGIRATIRRILGAASGRAALPVNEASGAWQIVSTRREQRRGWCMPMLIHNMQHHYTRLNVFEDGVVDCWEGLDLPLFEDKLATGWLSVAAPRGAMLSVFGLGAATVEAFAPLLSLADVWERVLGAVRHFNPDLVDLVDLQGSTTEQKGRFRRAKLPSLDGAHFRLGADGSPMLAKHVPVFIKGSGSLRLTQWFVYADGTARLGPEGELMELGAVEEAVLSESVVFSAPDSTWVELDGLGRAKLSRGSWGIDPLESIKEQRSNLVELQGGAGAVRSCVEAWDEYEREPAPARLEALRARYLDVPTHLRMYCGDMDTKDTAIRAALGMPRFDSTA